MDNLRISLSEALSNFVASELLPDNVTKLTAVKGVSYDVEGTRYAPFKIDCTRLEEGFLPALEYADSLTAMDSVVNIEYDPCDRSVRIVANYGINEYCLSARRVTCSLKANSTAIFWLGLAGQSMSPKKFMELIEDYGHSIINHNRLDLLQSLRQLKVRSDQEANIEYRATGETCRIRIDSEVKTQSVNLDLPTNLEVNTAMWSGSDVSLKIDLRANYSVADGKPYVRLLPVNPDRAIENALDTLRSHVSEYISRHNKKSDIINALLIL